MDKKELNSLIDRVSLTGPGGVDKIKKVLKELSDASSGSMGEDEEYTIAQALNDLNERLKAVEARPVPQASVLEVLSTSDSAEGHTQSLQRLLLNGHTPTLEEMCEVTVGSTILLKGQYTDTYFLVTYVDTDTVDKETVHIVAGMQNDGEADYDVIDILLVIDDDGWVHHSQN